ncbi:serine/threonine-protein kinase SBK1-like [Hyperolius riggenbachi]|uniref:serine/threonine-protein kinase SBK1-like n=1 Tax=Hyperolius riggenbachi TaxID=752182 RepID=UPI0035A39D25
MASSIEEVMQVLEDFISLASKRLQRIKLRQRFHIIKRLGDGGFGSVLLVKEKKTDQKMALKMMEREMTSKRKFLMECGVMSFLSSHPNIVESLGILFKTGEDFCFAQEVAPLGDLFSLIVPSVGLPEDIVKRCAVQISNALEFISQKGFVHMDLKPENVLVFDKDCQCVKVTDFGLAQVRRTTIRGQLGTVKYMAPEMCTITGREEITVDSNLDVWAFGVLLFCLMTGEFPWKVAMHKDERFRRFGDWQNHFQGYGPPAPWGKLSSTTLDIFMSILAIEPNTAYDDEFLCLSYIVFKQPREKYLPGHLNGQDPAQCMELELLALYNLYIIFKQVGNSASFLKYPEQIITSVVLETGGKTLSSVIVRIL